MKTCSMFYTSYSNLKWHDPINNGSALSIKWVQASCAILAQQEKRVFASKSVMPIGNQSSASSLMADHFCSPLTKWRWNDMKILQLWYNWPPQPRHLSFPINWGLNNNLQHAFLAHFVSAQIWKGTTDCCGSLYIVVRGMEQLLWCTCHPMTCCWLILELGFYAVAVLPMMFHAGSHCNP